MALTLVRHSMWKVDQFPLFRRGLEPLPVGLGTARLIRTLGGVLFSSPEDAWDAAEGFMYPSGDMDRPANPNGNFLDLPWLKLPLFVPEFSGDLLAV